MNETVTTCANHPDRETGLRCNRCGKPICSECAVLTPVGYRCKQCVRSQQQLFETARGADFVLVGILAAVAGGVGSLLLGMLGIWGLFAAPMVGGFIADILQRAIRPRRSRYMPWTAAGGMAAGVISLQLWKLFPYLALIGTAADLAWLLPTLLWPSVHALLMVIALFSRMKGIRL
ncbi:MAG: B-box zinc finger protein [Anaerolineales bacterium]|nr:B-box zinc finger protein [Anaerolineales bacterium]